MRHHIFAWGLAATLALAAGMPSRAQQDEGGETGFLDIFDGRFKGTGTLQNAGERSHNLTCEFDGDRQGSRVTLQGRCSTAVIFGTTVQIDLTVDPKTGRYDGSFREGRGTVADLAGTRRGDSLSLSFVETAESVRPNPPATLTINRRSGGLALTLRGSQPGRGQNLDLALNEV